MSFPLSTRVLERLGLLTCLIVDGFETIGTALAVGAGC